MRSLILTVLSLLCFMESSSAQSQDTPWVGNLESLSFEFALGRGMHLAQVFDAQELRDLSKAWRVVQHIAEPMEVDEAAPALLAKWPSTPLLTFHITGRNRLDHPRLGRLILAPSTFQALEAWASSAEQAQILLGVANPFPESRLERLFAFQALSEGTWRRAKMWGPSGRLDLEGARLLKELHTAFTQIYVPSAGSHGEAWGHRIEIQGMRDKPLLFELREGARARTRPLHSVLLNHPELGPVWVSDRMREVWLELYKPTNPLRPLPQNPTSVDLSKALAPLRALAHSKPYFFVMRSKDWDP